MSPAMVGRVGGCYASSSHVSAPPLPCAPPLRLVASSLKCYPLDVPFLKGDDTRRQLERREKCQPMSKDPTAVTCSRIPGPFIAPEFVLTADDSGEHGNSYHGGGVCSEMCIIKSRAMVMMFVIGHPEVEVAALLCRQKRISSPEPE